MTEPRDYLARNRAYWDSQAPVYAESAVRRWADDPTWGIFDAPEADIGMLPADAAGLDTIELGCGTAYVSAWLARRGARPVGIDNSPEQLATARRMQEAHELDFPLHLGDAEATPFDDASFDFAISEYGASIWCDPDRWIAEAARILRPGGRLVFLVNSTLMMLAMPEIETESATATLRRPQRGMRRFEWPDATGVEFHVSHGECIRILRRNGFEIEDLVEVHAPEGATSGFPWVGAEWARSWPCEEVWKARKLR